ncbi:MAG: hypothetical protein AB4911_04860 [Oscillochloridaceae bacterium umkhey_bin13]
MKRHHLVLLTVLIGFAVFPFGWLAQLSSTANTVGRLFFPNELAHNISHALLFASLGVILLVTVPALRLRPMHYGAIILLIGMAQEGVQLVYKQRGVVWNDLIDLVIDLTAAMVVYLLWHRATGWRQRTQGTGYAEPTSRRG